MNYKSCSASLGIFSRHSGNTSLKNWSYATSVNLLGAIIGLVNLSSTMPTKIFKLYIIGRVIHIVEVNIPSQVNPALSIKRMLGNEIRRMHID